MAYIQPNPGAEKAVEIFIELIKAGRYTTAKIADMLEEVGAIKKKVEEVYSDKSE